MATTPEEFFAESHTNPSPPSPSIFLDLPPVPNGYQGPFSPDGTVLSYISHMLMEEDNDDKLLYRCSDHPALLQVQQPFAEILCSPSSRMDHDNTNRGDKERVKDLFQNSSGYQSTLDSAFSKGVDAAGAFLKGMEEGNMFLPKANVFRRDGHANHISRESSSHCGVKKRYNREEHLDEVSRASKAVKMEAQETGAHEMFDEMMFRGYETCITDMENLRISMATESEKDSRKRISKKTRDVVDLRTLLILCAQAVAANNHISARELLKQIKKHASASGDATQRLAHCFSKGLEARLVGTGSHLCQLLMAVRPSVMEFLQAYKLYLAAGCFISVATTYSIMTIMHATKGKGKLHIVDYGPHFGFHLSGLLRLLATREGGPPEVKITVIGCPSLRSCPTEQSEDTGIRLSKCAREFGLPFKFHAIMMKSEKVCIGDLKTDADEVLVVNDLFNFSTLMDESVFFDHPCPRDTVLNNIRKMQPDVFIQSIVNYSCGFSFLSRFRGALFYYSALFDMLDATIPRENKLRVLLEQGFLGHAALNAIACEGVDLVDRPEKYREWQVRNQRAAELGLMQPLSRRPIQHRISIYADDVALFLRPATNDITLTLNILQLFGDASGLVTNVQKSNVMPIQCSDQDLTLVQDLLPCELVNFPSKYLGLPLSLKRLTRGQIQPIIDRIADQLQGWKADLMTRAGRVVVVQHVLTAMIVYMLMAVDLPPWAVKAIDKIRRGFLWKGRKDAQGGHCLIAWPKVCRDRELGGLGISDLKALGLALRVRWPWLQKSEPDKPWATLPLQTGKDIQALMSLAVYTKVGDGANTLFWKDRWLEGKCIQDLAPGLLGLVPKRRSNKRTVQEALINDLWLEDIQGNISVNTLMEFLVLWDHLTEVVLQDGIPDKHIWRLSPSGSYSAASAYKALFFGSIPFEPYQRIWKTWAPPKCRFFMWLVAHDRCWTADRLARRGLPHPPVCPLCNQDEESIQHLLGSCVFSRDFWSRLLNSVGLSDLAPQLHDAPFDDWWRRVEDRAGNGEIRQGLNSLIILGAWTIWKHRNECVFNNASPNVLTALTAAKEEAGFWALAGAKKLAAITGIG